MKILVLDAVEDPVEYWDRLEKRILRIFRQQVYLPILKYLTSRKLSNARDSALVAALKAGTVSYYKGSFRGSFSSAISKELRSLGAEWNPETKAFRLPRQFLPESLRPIIALADVEYLKKVSFIEHQLLKILPAKIADSIPMEDLFDKSIWKTEKNIAKTLEAVTVTPTLTPSQRKTIAAEWSDNLRLDIKGFTEKQVKKLRSEVLTSTIAGNRYESLVGKIKASYGVTARKAHFLARQETHLLTAKLVETRYQAAGVYEYQWACVVGSPAHPVRPSHKKLEGKIFRFDDPPVTTAPGEPERRNNPGEDYNCRCKAKPVVRRKSR